MPQETYPEPSLFVERSGGLHHTAHHGSQRGSNLLRGDAFRKFAAERNFCKQMEGPEAVTERSPDGWKCSLGADEPLLDRRVSLCPNHHRGLK